MGENVKCHGFFENKFSKDDLYLLTLLEQSDGQFDMSKMFFMSRNFSIGDITFK